MDYQSDTQTSLMDLLDYGKIFLKWSWLLILCALIGGYSAYYFSNLQPREYQSSTRLVVNMPSGAQDIDPAAQSSQLTTTYAKTMITKSLLNATAAKLGYPVTGRVSAAADATSPIIGITVNDTDPQKAADTANGVASVFIEDIDSKQTYRYSELETSIEGEIARIDEELTLINEKLASLQSGTSGTKSSVDDSETFVRRSQLELSLAQFTQTRYSLVYNLQQIRLSEIKSKTIISQLDPAVANPNPVKPQPVQSGMLGAVIGLLASGGIVFLFAYLQDGIRDPDEITRRWGIPVLGMIVRYKGSDETIITIDQPRAPITEAYRRLRTNLQFAKVDHPLQTILVTSPSPGDGKTSVVTNLAVVMNQNKSDVIIIDSDLRKPRVHLLFQIPNRLGLSDFFIQSEEQLIEVVKATHNKGLFVITSGSIPPNPIELLNSDKMVEILNLLKTRFNTVILDSPPVLIVADALVLASRVDGVILVVNPKKTKRAHVKAAIEQLMQVNANLLGVILNDVKLNSSHYYYSKKYYGKYYYAKQDIKSDNLPDSQVK